VKTLSCVSKHAKTFEDLRIFELARRMAADIWKITRNRPFFADRVLTGQIRRAGLSVVSNIAEGFERGSHAEFRGFLKIAKGSCGEVRVQIPVASDLNQISKRECEEFCSATRQVSAGLSNLNRYPSESAEKNEGSPSTHLKCRACALLLFYSSALKLLV
jgi:four helix bundle protein